LSNAIGLLESRGLTSLLSGLNVLLKSDGIELVNVYRVGGGILACVVRGDTNHVRLALDDAIEKVKSLQGEILAYQVIPEPHERLLDCLSCFTKEKAMVAP